MNRLKRTNYAHHFILAASFLFSVILKIAFIDAKELWLDETYTHFVVSRPWPEMMHFIVGDVHPPLYYLLLKAWSWIFGLTPSSLRAFSLLISCPIPLVVFFTARIIFKDKWIALLCFLLVLFESHIFHYSLEARSYIVALLFLSLLFYCYVQMLQKPKGLKPYVLFSVAGACAFYSHYFALFILLPMLMHFFVYLFKDRWPVKKIVISVILLSVLTAPWLPVMLRQWEQRNLSTDTLASATQKPETLNYGYPLTARSHAYLYSRIYQYVRSSAFGTYAPKPRSHILKWMVRAVKFLFVCLFLLALFRKDEIAILLVMVCAVYTLCEFLAMKTVFADRYFLFVSLFIPFCVCTAVQQTKSMGWVRPISILATILIVISFCVKLINISTATYCKPYSRAAEFLEQNDKAGDLIVFNNLLSEVPFDTYSHLSKFKAEKTGFPISIYVWWKSQANKGWSGPIITKHHLEDFIEQLRSDEKIKRIWLVTEKSMPFDPGRQLLQRMSENYPEFEKRYTDQCRSGQSGLGLEIYLFTSGIGELNREAEKTPRDGAGRSNERPADRQAAFLDRSNWMNVSLTVWSRVSAA